MKCSHTNIIERGVTASSEIPPQMRKERATGAK